MQFQIGEVVRHKATLKTCVVLQLEGEYVRVRTQDDEVRNYYPHELEKEEE